MEEIRDVHFGWIRNYDVQFLPKRDKKCDTEYIQCGVVGLRRNLFTQKQNKKTYIWSDRA